MVSAHICTTTSSILIEINDKIISKITIKITTIIKIFYFFSVTIVSFGKYLLQFYQKDAGSPQLAHPSYSTEYNEKNYAIEKNTKSHKYTNDRVPSLRR